MEPKPHRSDKISVIYSKRKFLIAFSLVLLCALVATNIFIYYQQHNVLAAPQPEDTSSATYQGTSLGGISAPNFQLHDQQGKTLSLSQLRGSPVVLTFLYTTCPGPCPITAEKMRVAVHQLGAQAKQVHWVAISVNPTVDTPGLASAFVQAHDLTGYLHFLIGTQAQLQPIWNAYHISVQSASDGTMTHSVGLYIIDAQGREHTYFDDSFTGADLSTQLQQLLKN